MIKRIFIASILTFTAAPAFAATTITLVSDASTLGVETTLASAQAGDTTGLVFASVAVGAFGTFTGTPPGSPAGTLVINIAPGNGANGFFRDIFTLPAGFFNISISGAASIDDETVVYLNGHALTGAGHDVTFSSSDSSFFNVGSNFLEFSDLNTGAGPSGGGFYAYVTFDTRVAGVPEPSSWAMMIAGIALTGTILRARKTRTHFAIAR